MTGAPRLNALPTTTMSGRKIELFGAVAFDEFDAERGQLRAHRRIDIEIRAGDAKSGRLGDCRHPSHEGTGDS